MKQIYLVFILLAACNSIEENKIFIVSHADLRKSNNIDDEYSKSLEEINSLNNLIDNSVKYGKKTNLIMEKKNSNIFISIEDDGPGIPKSEYKNVIKPFYKIDKSRSQESSSVGLGLSISSDIVRSHGGKIELGDSKYGGLKVIISLPF